MTERTIATGTLEVRLREYADGAWRVSLWCRRCHRRIGAQAGQCVGCRGRAGA